MNRTQRPYSEPESIKTEKGLSSLCIDVLKDDRVLFWSTAPLLLWIMGNFDPKHDGCCCTCSVGEYLVTRSEITLLNFKINVTVTDKKKVQINYDT